MTPFRANGVTLMAAMFWGLGNVMQKTVLDRLDGFAVTGITAIIGAVVVAPFAVKEARQCLPALKGSLGLLVKASVLFSMAATLMQFGYGQTSVTNAGFLVNTAAVITPVVVWVFFGERQPLWLWGASLCALAGVFLMAGGRWAGFSFGDLLCLAAALCFAVWTVAVGLYVTRYRRPVLLTIVQLAVCGILCLGLGSLTYGMPTTAALAAALPEIIFLGVISKGLAYVLIAVAQQHVSATGVSILVSAEAVFGAALASVFLGETLGPVRAAGAFCIITGVIIASTLQPAAPASDRLSQGPQRRP